MAKRLSSQSGAIGGMMSEVGSNEPNRLRHPDGMLSDSAPVELIAAEVKARRCFVTENYTVGAFGMHPVVPGERSGDFAIDRWLTSADVSARAVAAAAPPTDAALTEYLTKRKDRLRIAHAYFGEPGLEYALQRFGEGDHATALVALGARLKDPRFTAALGAAGRAEVELLIEDPTAFVPCEARKPAVGGGLRRIG